MIPPLYKHQAETVQLLEREPFVFDMSDPGTGKTRPALEAFWKRRQAGSGPLVVLAPKSILKPAWGNEIDTFFPGMTYMIATAANRAKAFAAEVDVYITNHDASTWMMKNWSALKKTFKDSPSFIVDEGPAYKNGNAQRSKAARFLTQHFAYRELMSGTPNPNTILEIWHQMMLVDRGQRLGDSFWRFRSMACEPKQIGPRADMLQWVDKDGIELAVYDIIRDCSIRHKFEDCVSIPPNVQRTIRYDLPKGLRKQYDDMLEHSRLQAANETITAVHAASLKNKLLQIASGAVYSGGDRYTLLDNGRTELIMDLVEQRPHSLVAFLWKHQRDTLIAEAVKRGLTYGVIDGETPDQVRIQVAADFQAGKLRVLFVHPKSAGHGLTLTRGTAAIWASPTYNSEWTKQFFHRIYRAGQTQPTETINVIARDTADEHALARRDSKLTAMALLLDLMEAA